MAEQSTEQSTEKKPFLERVIEKCDLKTTNEAQAATNVVFRIMRDMMSNETVDRIEGDLQVEAPLANMEVADLWSDTNTMVAFFSRISPLRPIDISAETFMLRLNQEGFLPADASPEQVTKAVFAATKDELSSENVQDVAKAFPEDVRQLWETA
ncbi:MAG: DUF2267 domain-containing protein [Elainellaceae cyanobacterium]